MKKDGPAQYEIRMQGTLGEDWLDWFDGMTMGVCPDEDGNPVTTLTGRVVDQSALQGILSRISSLNLPLISVTRVREDEK